MFNKFLRKITSVKGSLVVALMLLVFGLLVIQITSPDVWNRQKAVASGSQSQALQSNQPTQNSQPLVNGNPVRLVIPSLGIDLKVIPG